MQINRENYEPYFIDLLDGTLSNEMVDELLDFLRLNPDLAADLKGMESIQLEAEELQDFDYSGLLKSGFDQPDVLNETCIRSIEKDLAIKEEEEFQNYLATHKQAKAEYNLFRATISEPDLLVVYPDKNNLKHRLKIMPVWYAAAAVLILGLVFWFNVPPPTKFNTVAQSIPVLQEQPKVDIDLAPLKNKFKTIKNADRQKTGKEIQIAEQLAARKDISINPMQADLTIAVFENSINEEMALAAVTPKSVVDAQEFYPTVPELIAQEVNKIDVKAEAKKVGHFALDKLRDITDDKLSYATGNSGEIRKIDYNSRLLAFSVPVNSKGN